MFQLAQGKAVAARLVYFPDENHWVLKPQNSRLCYREFFEWLGAARRQRAVAVSADLARGPRYFLPRSRFSAVSWHATQRRAAGYAASRAKGIALPQSTHSP